MKLIITEKPSVARQFAQTLGVQGKNDGYIENGEWVITWALGHLVTLSYPEKYDEKYKKWNLDDLPFLPAQYIYEVIKESSAQFKVVKSLLNRKDIDVVYNAGDSGREGEYIQRLIFQEAGIEGKKKILRVWIDSQTDAEILRGIKEAKPESQYDNLSEAAFMRAIEDYAMGINFSRALSKKYGNRFNSEIKSDKWKSISVGRVMTCVLGMVVNREQEIRAFVETPFYKVNASCDGFDALWKAVEGSKYKDSALLYNETGFKKKEDADALAEDCKARPTLTVENIERKNESKNAPLLFNLAELQAECTKAFKLSPDETLAVAQKLYELKLTTYPRTDARVLSTAVADVIDQNIKGLAKMEHHADTADWIIKTGAYKGISKKKYTDDSHVTDHYAIIPTGEGSTSSLSDTERLVYEKIVDRFLAIFMPPAVYAKTTATLLNANGERFIASASKLKEEGWMALYEKNGNEESKGGIPEGLNRGALINASYSVTEGKTQPPKRYTSGSMVLAMENAGNLIEEEELREQIKGAGIGTSATRAGIIKKLVDVGYLSLNKKTQVITPHPDGEKVYAIVNETIPDFLSPKMTASWEKGLAEIESGTITRSDYMDKMNKYIEAKIAAIKELNGGEAYEGEAFERKVVGICPICGKDVVNTRKGNYVCTGFKKDDPSACRFAVPKKVKDKELTQKQMETLFMGGSTEVINGFKSANGGTFSASLSIVDGKLTMTFPEKEERESLGSCPNCGGDIVSGKFGAYCVNKCGMLLNKAMGKTLTDAQVKALLKAKTVTLTGLKSAKTGNKYDMTITPTGIEDYSYTKDNGEVVKGKRFSFATGFPEKDAKNKKGKKK